MKGLVIEQEQDYNPHFDYLIFIVVPEKQNLAISREYDEMLASTDFVIDGNCEVIGEVDVPDDLIEAALSLIPVQKKFNAFATSFAEILPANAIQR
jgi:hypothetical protein